MPRFGKIWHKRDEIRSALLEWLENEPNAPDPGQIIDDGRFSVHNGRISGNLFLFDDTGHKILHRAKEQYARKHFNVTQVNPLPDILLED